MDYWKPGRTRFLFGVLSVLCAVSLQINLHVSWAIYILAVLAILGQLQIYLDEANKVLDEELKKLTDNDD